MHAIRLRGPWAFSIGGTSASGRIDFPSTWRQLVSAAASAGREPTDRNSITLRRRFHRPTGLETGDRVVLSLAHSGKGLTARLNGAELALLAQSGGSLEAEITSSLADHNELAVELAPPSTAPLDSAASVLEATLEIHSA